MSGAAGNAAPASRRQRNARGQGSRLTEDIVTAALNLIDREGTQEAVTLRAVAREIGIAAPSIYAHFADRDAIVAAVVARLFDELAVAIGIGEEGAADDPVERLVDGCQAYVRYGDENPARYQVLFTEPRSVGPVKDRPVMQPGQRPDLPAGTEAFAMLADSIEACVNAGVSASTDIVADGAAIWTALHGTVTLRAARPLFPWPEPADDFVRGIVLRLARIVTPA